VELIQLKEVGKQYKKLGILQNVNLTVNEGDIVGVIGQSGSGKTTLLNLIGGYIRPSQGTVSYFSRIDHTPKELKKHFHKIKKHIGFTHQHYSFYPKLTVKENLIHFGKLMGVKGPTLVENAVSLLKFTGLYEHKGKLADQLSGGMQKRLDIACSLIHKPRILLLDEPTADLDPILQDDIIRLIQEVNEQGITVIMASHDLQSVERICTKIAMVNRGTVYDFGHLEDVRRPFLKRNISINIETGQDREKMIALARQLPVNRIIDQGHRLVLEPADASQTLHALLQLAEQENLSLHDIDVRRPSLSEIFQQIAVQR
jgi:ABC-2 type transport system ATP-binding protein